VHSHVVDHTSMQNLVSVSVRRLQLNTWYLSQWLPHQIHMHSGAGSLVASSLGAPRP
jgi:hypothetical protein